MTFKHLLSVSIALVYSIGVVACVEAQDLRLNVTRADEYATRRMVITKKSGEQINTLVAIQSFDPASGAFVMAGVTGETVTLQASDVREILFLQTAARLSPMAQQAYWEIRETLGPAMRYKVAEGSLQVVSGDLVLPTSSPATTVPLPIPPPLPPLPGASSAGSIKVTEARKLTYDSAGKFFALEVQDITYTKYTSGSPGASGIRK